MPMEEKAMEMVGKCPHKYFQHLCDDRTNISSISVVTWRYTLLMLAARYEVRGPEAADAKAGPSH